MSEPIKGFNRAQRAYDAQEPPEFYAKRPDCGECGADESISVIERGGELMGDPWIEIRCEECGYEKRLYAEIPEASNEQ